MKITTLVGHAIGVEEGREPESSDSSENVSIWTLVLIDAQTGDQTRIGFRDNIRVDLIRMLTSGIVVANGGLKK